VEVATLRMLREKLGLNQASLAAKLGKSQGQVSRTEANDDPRISTIKEYVEALGGKLEVTVRCGTTGIKLTFD